MSLNLQLMGEQMLSIIKSASWFPYKTGKLKFHATRGWLINSNLYQITFDTTVAPYITYLEEGTSPHNIPRAFGHPLPFGTSGRFNGKFHPGSTKHQGFIKDKCVNAIVENIATRYRAEVRN